MMSLKTSQHMITWILDGLLLALLGAYTIAGYVKVPFHGDESMQIYLSRDYYYMVQTHNVKPLLFRESVNTEIGELNQQLRTGNGIVNRLTTGLAWDIAGYTVNDLNQPWYWGMPDEWAWNSANGGVPTEGLLHDARLPSTLFTALSVGVIFAITWMITHHHTASRISALVYVTYPAILLNGRRAMMEGSCLFFSALVILAALCLVQALSPRRRMTWAVLLGMTSGLALASKYTAALTVAVAFLSVGLLPVVQRISGARGKNTTNELSYSQVSAAAFFFPLATAGLLAVGVFLALNPAWWSNPLQVAKYVFNYRRDLLESQIVGAKAAGDYYDHGWQRLEALAQQALFAPAQYYEVPYWSNYIANQIADYDGSWLAGRSESFLWAGLLLVSSSAGIAVLGKRWHDGPAWIGLVWLAGTALALLVLIPMNWQRYYLPLFAPVSMVSGVGADHVIMLARCVLPARNGE